MGKEIPLQVDNRIRMPKETSGKTPAVYRHKVCFALMTIVGTFYQRAVIPRLLTLHMSAPCLLTLHVSSSPPWPLASTSKITAHVLNKIAAVFRQAIGPVICHINAFISKSQTFKRT
jgi:hypothetical protein